MDYGDLGKSAVPHVTTLGVDFEIQYIKYKYSLIIESSFIILVLPLLAIWIYFSAKYKSPKKKKQQDEQQGAENNQLQNRSQANQTQMGEAEEGQQDEYDRPQANMQQQFTLNEANKSNTSQIKKKLEIAERRICFGVCFFVLHAIAVNQLDANIISIVTFYVAAACYAIFNVIRPTKIFLFQGLYILPTVVSAVAIWAGKHQLGTHITS